MTKATEQWITASDGQEIYTKTWHADTESGKPIASLVFIHGLGEHINRYNHVFEQFAKANIQVSAYDQRGFGQTGKKSKALGNTGGYAKAIPDITAALERAKIEGVPQFLMGHSYGGSLVLNYDVLGPKRQELAGVIASAPLILPSPETRPNAVTVGAAKVFSRVLPSLQIPVKLNTSYISRNKDEVAKYDTDPLVHPYMSILGSYDMVTNAKALLTTRFKDLTATVPVLITHGTADGLTCCKASREFFDKLTQVKDKEYATYDGWYHELHNEDGRQEVIDKYISWIKAHAVPRD
ncbi:hypothetical protein BGW41_001818 [Actinomortierella wolfii]|nr:hypothetical protein BGW41_001818 [Actinomortierella wolfii]